MYCDSCKLDCKYKSPVFPSGTITPDIYILGDYSDSSDIEHKIVYNLYTQKGMYLHNVLSSLGLDTKCRIFNNIRCDISNQYQDYKDIYKYCSEYAKIDIYKTNPKVIITLGADSAKLLLGSQFDTLNNTHGKLMTAEIKGKKFKVVPTYSLSYILKEFTDSEKFINDFRFAKSFIEGKLVDISSKRLEVARNYEEFIEYYNKNLKDKDFISYDIETNAMDPRSEDAEIVGFSLAPSGMTGIYISRRTLDYSMPEDDWNKITKFVVENIISKHKILVHNCMYEIPFTLNKWNYYITNFEDSLIKARLVLGGTIGAGLKEQCIKQLNYPDWDKDLGNYLSSMKALINGLKPTSSGKLRDEYNVLKDNSLVKLSNYEFTSSNKRTDSISSSSKLILRVLNKYYSGDELSDIINKVSKEIIRLVDIDFTGMLSYGVVPSKIIARYGAMDAVATQDLNKFLDQRIDELSDELKINLHNGYKYLKQHFVAGTWMELNGMNWNDEVATQEYNWYNNKCIECAMNMINSHFLDEYLFQNTQSEYNQYLVDNKLDELIDVFGNFKVTKSGIKPDGGKLIRFKNILPELGQNYINSHRDDIINLARLNASKIHDNYKNLKKYFNPASPTKENKEFLSNIFVTDETRVARIIQKLQVLIDDPSVDKSAYLHEHELLRVLTDYASYNKFVSEYDSSEDKDEYLRDNLSKLKYNMYYVDNTSEYKKLSNKDRFNKFVEVLSKSHIVSKDIEKIVIDSYRYKMESVSELDLIEINELYVISGVDVDNPDTWTDSYRFLVNFRLWKKCNKIITSYIEGDRVGRGSVYIVDKSSYKNGDTITRRKRLYDDPPKSDEMCVMQSKFGVCTAESYRWRSGLHTIPMGVSVRHIYTSRYDGGVIAAPDFSQMELRTMAGAANCEPMMEAFRNGADIHRENAAKIFRKPPEEISHEERRYSKMACIVGSTKIKLANGKISSIEDIYNSGLREFYVYSFNLSRNKIAPGLVRNVELVKSTNELVRVTLSNGKHIDTTYDHLYLLQSGKYVKASELNVGDRLETLFYRTITKGAYSSSIRSPNYYEQIRDVRHKYYAGLHAMYGKWRMTHVEFYKEYFGNNDSMIDETTNIDHIDHNSLNNSIENLRTISQVDNMTRSYNKILTDRFGILTQASNVVKMLLRERLELTESNFDQMMAHMYEGRRHLYWKTVSRYYTFHDICQSIMTRANYKVSGENLVDYSTLKKFKLNEIAGLDVVKVEFLDLKEPVNVYELSVDKYHNYAIDLGDNTGVFTHNSFMILYGGDYKNFSKEFLGGDENLGKYIYDSFYSAYPQIEDYIKSKHEEARTKGKVTTLMDMFMYCTPSMYQGDVNRQMRVAQNSVIQSASSMIAGCCLYKIMEYIWSHKMKTKIILFVHDSVEVDIPPEELIEIGSQIIPIMSKFPNEQFHMPVKADLVLGGSLGKEVEVHSIEHNDDYSEGILDLEGYQDEVNELIELWKPHFRVVEATQIGEVESEYKSWSQLWIPKLAIQKGYGTYRYKVHMKVRLVK